jgi:hypothetical protein
MATMTSLLITVPRGYCGPEWFNGEVFIGAGSGFMARVILGPRK